MGINDIKLSGAMNRNLLALQGTQKLMDRTQERLATGLKVNSAIDNPTAYFAAQSLTQRATDLDSLLDSMGQAIQTLKAADEGIKGITKYIEQAKALANQASELSDDPADTIAIAKRADLATQYNLVRTQITEMANDSGYKGINLINDTAGATTLTVYFNEQLRSSTSVTKLDISGVDATSAGLGLTVAAGSWATKANVDTDMDLILTAVETLRGYASGFGNDYSVVQNREEFTEALVNVLTEGSDQLTLADSNEESANMLSLQTRQQLGVNSLSLASQAQQSVLKLFG